MFRERDESPLYRRGREGKRELLLAFSESVDGAMVSLLNRSFRWSKNSSKNARVDGEQDNSRKCQGAAASINVFCQKPSLEALVGGEFSFLLS
jgi:hypothetical protein